MVKRDNKLLNNFSFILKERFAENALDQSLDIIARCRKTFYTLDSKQSKHFSF